MAEEARLEELKRQEEEKRAAEEAERKKKEEAEELARKHEAFIRYLAIFAFVDAV